MHGSYTFTLPAGVTNLYAAIITAASPLPDSFTIPKMVQELEIQADTGNLASIVTVYSGQNLPGRQLYAGDDYVKRSGRNSIDLTQYALSGSGLKVEVEIEAI